MDGKVAIEVELGTKKFDKQIAKLENELERLNFEYEMLKKARPYAEQQNDLIDYEAKIEVITDKIETLKHKQDDLDSTGPSKFKEGLVKIGNETENVIKKIARWSLAIFSIRSAYMMVRQAVSTISQYDKQVATDIEYIRFALASALKPIIETIINLVYKLLAYIGYIAKAWFGVNLFANASAKAFQKVNKGVKDTGKSAKQLQKTLAGFDEMNILQDNGSVSTGGGGGGIGIPSTDLSNLGNINITWLDKLLKNKKFLLQLLGGISGFFIAIKKGWGIVKGLGIGIAVGGIVKAIEKIIDFTKDPSFENFTGILEGIATATLGIGIAVKSLPAIYAGAIGLIVITVVNNFDKIKKKLEEINTWMEVNFLGKLKEVFGPIGNIIYLPFEWAIRTIRELFDSFWGGIKKWIEGIKLLFSGDFKGGLELIFEGLLDIMFAPFNALVEGLKTIIGRIKTFFGDLFIWLRDKFVSPLLSKFGSIISKLKEILGLEKKTNVTGGGGAGGFGGGKSGGRAKGGIYYPSKLPKLALGGIINSPGAGVPYHGAYIGERGAEAVVPLTDSQQMELLGQTIGRYITVNASIVNTMNGRVISRELKTIQNEENFAFNGG